MTMTTLRDNKTFEDIKTLFDRFYDKVNRDELLGPIFNNVAKVEWATHLPTPASANGCCAREVWNSRGACWNHSPFDRRCRRGICTRLWCDCSPRFG